MSTQVGNRVVFARTVSKNGGSWPQFRNLIGKTATITEVNFYGDGYLVWDDQSTEGQEGWAGWVFDPGELFDAVEEVNEWEGNLELE